MKKNLLLIILGLVVCASSLNAAEPTPTQKAAWAAKKAAAEADMTPAQLAEEATKEAAWKAMTPEQRNAHRKAESLGGGAHRHKQVIVNHGKKAAANS